MSIPDRIGRIGKAYVGAIKERIENELAEREAAMDELDGSAAKAESDVTRKSRPVPPPPQSELTDVESLMRRAEEKIAAARREVEARKELPTGSSATVATAVVEPSGSGLLADFKTLGVADGSDLATVQAAYEDLLRRCDPKRFPEGSIEQDQARRLLDRINLAYENIRRQSNPTEDRFAKLEL